MLKVICFGRNILVLKVVVYNYLGWCKGGSKRELSTWRAPSFRDTPIALVLFYSVVLLEAAIQPCVFPRTRVEAGKETKVC